MKNLIRDIPGILGAFLIWWAAAVLLGMAMFAIWPPGKSYTAGIALDPQNLPGNILGFILALYAFRRITAGSKKQKTGMTAPPNSEQTGCTEPRDCVSVPCAASLARGR